MPPFFCLYILLYSLINEFFLVLLKKLKFGANFLMFLFIYKINELSLAFQEVPVFWPYSFSRLLLVMESWLYFFHWYVWLCSYLSYSFVPSFVMLYYYESMIVTFFFFSVCINCNWVNSRARSIFWKMQMERCKSGKASNILCCRQSVVSSLSLIHLLFRHGIINYVTHPFALIGTPKDNKKVKQ